MASVLDNYTYHSSCFVVSCFVVGMACATAVATAMAIGSLVDFIYSSGFLPAAFQLHDECNGSWRCSLFLTLILGSQDLSILIFKPYGCDNLG